MKKNIFILFGLVAILFISCKKDEISEPRPNVVGYWKGNARGTTALAFINRENGTSRMYAAASSANDTATAPEKYDGTWTLNGRFFFARFKAGTDSVFLQAIMTEPFEVMSGFVSSTGFFATPFEAIKQP